MKHPDDAGTPLAPPREIPVSTAHPELRYQLDEEGGSVETAPVYRRVPGGEVVVPTGRVLVRFGDADNATDHESDLRAAGYVVDEVLSYATNTAWVRATDGSIGHGLRAIGELSKLPGVAAVEPEMIGTSARR